MMEKTLPEVCTIQYGFPFDSSKFCSAEGVPLVRIRDVVRGYSETYTTETAGENYIVKDGDLLIGMDGEFNIAYWKGGRAYLNQRVCRLIPREDVDRDYIFYYMPKALKAIEDATPFVTVKHLSAKQLSKILIPLPDMKEQQRISAVLRSVDRVIAMRQKELDELNNLVKSRFIELFGDPVINPKGFPCYTVGEVIDFQGGSQPDKKFFEYEASPDNIRLIQIRDYKSDKYITYIPKTMAKRFCTADDIMIGRYGPPIFQILKGIEGSFNVALMKATPKMGNREFIRQFLKQDCLLEYLEGLSKRTAGQDGIQMDKLKAYPFPYPPMEMQEQFAAFVEQTDKSKLAVQKGLQELEILKKSLMQQYFG